jgi:protein-S-isoprenylcysteine O-methyltransferase Ste14
MTFSVRVLTLRLQPGLIQERDSAFARAESKSWDKLLVAVLAGLCPLAIWIIAGLSQRFALVPRVPTLGQWVAVAALVAGGAISGWAMLCNPFFSSVVRIQKDRGHTVVSTGPYAVVRHPGYAGMLLFNLGTPVVLDAVWALIPATLVVVTLVLRTVMEDRTLHRELDGYADYARRVRHRLMPGIG